MVHLPPNMNARLTAGSDLVQSPSHRKGARLEMISTQLKPERNIHMLRKTLIALAATAAIGTAMASTAEAHHHHNKIIIGVGLGGFGYGGGYGGGYGYNGGYYSDNYYGGDCGWQWVNVKKWNKWHTGFIFKHKKVWSCY
jgi:hypothetical protein